jgi:hypothetical protein
MYDGHRVLNVQPDGRLNGWGMAPVIEGSLSTPAAYALGIDRRRP